MKGPELAGNLTSIKPGIRVLYMSGYSGFAHRGLINSDAIILAKPFSREALLNKVHEVLARISQKSGASSENSVPLQFGQRNRRELRDHLFPHTSEDKRRSNRQRATAEADETYKTQLIRLASG